MLNLFFFFPHCCKHTLRIPTSYLWKTILKQELFYSQISICLQVLTVTGPGMAGCAGAMLLPEPCRCSVVLTTSRISTHQVWVHWLLHQHISHWNEGLGAWCLLFASLKSLMLQDFRNSRPIICIFLLSHRKLTSYLFSFLNCVTEGFCRLGSRNWS